MSTRNNSPPRRRAIDLFADKSPDQYQEPCGECLVLRFRELTAFLLFRGFSREDAIEAVQRTCVKAIQTLNTYGPAHFANHRAWLTRVLINTAAAVRKERLRCCADDLAETIAPPADEIERCDDACAVRRAVHTLPEQLRQVVTLHYFDGLTYEEVAAELKITIARVKHRLARARQELRDALLARGFQAEQ